MSSHRLFFTAFLVLFFDQFLKIMVKINMYLGEEVSIIHKILKIRFEENNGFAFGMEFSELLAKVSISMSPETSKIILSLFSIIAVIGLGYVLLKFAKHKSPLPFFIALIFGGAMGNIIDRTFYGVIFGPINMYEGGFLQGRVVDMLYFDIGGNNMVAPVFNIADAAIFTGIIVVLIFQSKFLRMHERRSVDV